MRTTGWGAEDPDPLADYEHFGKKAQRWYRRRIWTKLLDFAAEQRSRAGTSISNLELAALFRLLVWSWGLYVTWRDDEECRGGRYSDGAWTINWDRVDEHLPRLLQQNRAEAALAAIETLDDWLRADLSASLPSFPYPIQGGSADLDSDLKRSLADSARARRRNWPLLCVDCGATFRRAPGSRGTPIRCADCLASRKSHGRSG